MRSIQPHPTPAPNLRFALVLSSGSRPRAKRRPVMGLSLLPRGEGEQPPWSASGANSGRVAGVAQARGVVIAVKGGSATSRWPGLRTRRRVNYDPPTEHATARRSLPLTSVLFYAGALALLVSHGEGYSELTVKLIGSAVRALSDRSVGRAEALRRAMVNLIDYRQANEAHPAYWAPFVVVPKGAVAR